MRSVLSITLGTLLVLAGCNFNEQRSLLFGQLFSQDSEKLVSNRPQKIERAHILIKLNNPPLLQKTGEKNDQRKVVLNKEQDQVIESLKKISTDIQVIFRYRLVMNGLYVVVPEAHMGAVEKLIPLGRSFRASQFGRPQSSLRKAKPISLVGVEQSSVKFIGADFAHQQNIKGQSIKVGIIDTGIDYTHKMLGGSGNSDLFAQINPNLPTEHFPNNKVVGGIDLVGTHFNMGSPNPAHTLPLPDLNPIDEAYHGTHVAGTVAGVGDGEHTYDGVAPDADLYAIKVFGADGGTSDAVVIAAFEYAADPNGDLDSSDMLDVVNLSLGSDFGSPKILYNEVINTVSKAGMIVVAAAGNSGAEDFIVGAPSTANAALSVAASIDDMPHNVEFEAVAFNSEAENFGEKLTEIVEGPVSRPLSQIENLSEQLVYVGYAKELSEEQKQLVKGKIALVDRGEVSFFTKLWNVEQAGAIGAVVANNQPGAPFPMGGDGKVSIPAVMISNDMGVLIKQVLETGASVSINFKPGQKLIKQELIDTITDFSSKGPRSGDAQIKPEIAAPGQEIISAAMGSGFVGMPMSGTSMASPHMAGVMALMKQKYPQLSVAELKAITMISSKEMREPSGEVYPVSMQGAGRVQVEKALQAQVILSPSAISLGVVDLEKFHVISRTLTVKNISRQSQVLIINGQSLSEGLSVTAEKLSLKPQESRTVTVKVKIDATRFSQRAEELSGFISVSGQSGELLARVPVLAVAVLKNNVKVLSYSEKNSQAHLTLVNKSNTRGQVLFFNRLGKNGQKSIKNKIQDSHKSRLCDLESVGVRVVEVEEKDQLEQYVQFAFKTHEPMTSWHFCETSILFDLDGDGQADKELSGMLRDMVQGLGSGFASLLFDAKRVREIRKEFEESIASGVMTSENYLEAIEGLAELYAFPNSSIQIVQMPLRLISDTNLNLRYKAVMVANDSDNLQMDEYLNGEEWQPLNLSKGALAYENIPMVVSISPKSKEKLSIKKGKGSQALMVLQIPSALRE